MIIKADLQHLHTNMFLLEHFFFTKISTTEIGFTIVNFKAAVEYLKSDELQRAFQGTTTIIYTDPLLTPPSQSTSARVSKPEPAINCAAVSRARYRA